MVKVFDGSTGALRHNFFAFDPTFTGGVNVAAAKELTGTLILAAASGGSRVRVFDGLTFTHDFNAFDPSFLGGVSVAAGSFGGLDSLIVGTQTGAAEVRVFNFADGRRISAFTAFRSDGGVNVAASFDAAVPEPTTWALMIGGFGMAGWMLRRRRRATA